jgi:PKD domain/Dockerin type I domain
MYSDMSRILLVLLAFASFLSASAAQVLITSPSNGDNFQPGQTITVVITSSEPLSSVTVAADPLGIPELQSGTGPYTFSLTIPTTLVGSVQLTAVALTATNQNISSETITVDVESATPPVLLTSDYLLFSFSYTGEQRATSWHALFPDGTELDVTKSSNISFSSADPTVARIDSTGLVTAVGGGFTTVIAAYGGLSSQMFINIPRVVLGDLDGDGRVTADDMRTLEAFLGAIPTGPFDARDLNGDGKIDNNDLQMLITICGTACGGTQGNSAPVANAGSNQTLECSSTSGTPATLNGSGSRDPNGGTLSYVWKNSAGQTIGNQAIITETLAPGTFNFSLSVTNTAGLSNSATTSVTIEDTIAPTLSLSTMNVAAILPTASATGASVSFAEIVSVSDTCDAKPTITSNAPSLFPVGLTNVTFTASDGSGNRTQKSLAVQVEYVFGGINPPISDKVFTVGQTLPVKFQLFAADHSVVSTGIAHLQAFLNTSSGLVPVRVSSVANSNSGTLFRYDPIHQNYIYNLNTKGFSPGTYLLRVVLNDQTSHDVSVVIH